VVSTAEVAERLKVSRRTAERRLKVAEAGGYIRNDQEWKHRRAKWVTDSPLPEETGLLPELPGTTVDIGSDNGGEAEVVSGGLGVV